MITVFTPFQRKENISLLADVLKGKANWTVLVDDPSLEPLFPDWVTVKKYDKPRDGICKPNSLVNQFISGGLEDETQYMILCDDDSVEDGFFEKIPDKDIVCVSMKRGFDTLIAARENMQIAKVGGEQVIVKGKILRNFRYGLSSVGDGEFIEKLVQEHEKDITYVPDAYVVFNRFQDGWYADFRRKPLVFFVGDYWCAGNPAMGLSEWEGNIANSLDSTGLVTVKCFHFDKYYYHTGKRPDQALIDRIEEFRPDAIVLIVYKELGSNPTVMHPDTLKVLNLMGIPIITIWGDLEAEQQRAIARTVSPYTKVNIGTANRSATESVGFEYKHVPKDPRIWNNPKKERDIDILFYGSFGLGREERQKYMIHLLDNGTKLVHGGSEGRDHFPTEFYADGYKRAKLALSFSKAHGMNVVNARPFEAMLCGAMLLEQDSPELAKMYTPYVDYVPWISEVDLLEKVRYYLEHDGERKVIAANGQKKTEELYSALAFWKPVIDSALTK